MALLPRRNPVRQLPRIGINAEDFTTLLSTADFRQTLLDRIATAQRRIYIAALYLEQDEAGREVMAALQEARRARPELDIRIMVDWHRAQRGRIGEAAGDCNAAWYRQACAEQDIPVYGIPVQTRELFGVLHLKGFVIDETVIYSGASLNNVYLHKLDKYRFDRYHLIHSKALADTMTSFMERYFFNDPAVFRLDKPVPSSRSIRKEIRAFRARLEKARYIPSGLQNRSGLGVTPVAGLGKGNPLNKLILQLLDLSQHKLVICTPYFNFPTPVVRALNRALRRGVRIDIIIGDKTANDFYIPDSEPFKLIGALPYLYEMNLRRFAKRHQSQLLSGQLNLHLWKDNDNTYHLKGLWCDDEHLLITGNNMNPRAFRLDLENALLVHDPDHKLAGQSHMEQTSILRHTHKLADYHELDSVRHYPEKVRKILTRLSRVRIDRMLNLML